MPPPFLLALTVLVATCLAGVIVVACVVDGVRRRQDDQQRDVKMLASHVAEYKGQSAGRDAVLAMRIDDLAEKVEEIDFVHGLKHEKGDCTCSS